jgi:hypothetical protein
VARAGLADDVAVPGQRVLDEHGIVAGRIQGPPGLVGDGHVREVASTLEVDGADVEELTLTGWLILRPWRGRRWQVMDRHVMDSLLALAGAWIPPGPVLTRGTPPRGGLPASKPGLCAGAHDLRPLYGRAWSNVSR